MQDDIPAAKIEEKPKIKVREMHLFNEEHKGDDKGLTFPYATAGMRSPGVPFNFTEINFG